jgi:UDP-N-acetylglucosamine--N-acetylmuramyl-(pentapeptide) pyrophosphoryl-undecaprenol N-acetylglucosamine transferase
MNASNASPSPIRLLVAASGTGGHLFPAIAVAQDLADTHYPKTHYEIEWLGVRDRMETQLVPKQYPMHIIPVQGLQSKPNLKTLAILGKFILSFWQTRQLLKRGKFRGVVTTGGYIAAPAILAARSLGLPSVLHESNAIPGKVTRFLSRWCSAVALGFAAAQPYLPGVKTLVVGTPVRDGFLKVSPLDLEIPKTAFVVVVMGGSQGARKLNQLVRQCAPLWLQTGLWIVHLTGDRDPDAQTLIHPHYIEKPFYDNTAGLLQRANLAISRSGAGTMTELAMTGTPSLLIPFPFAAEDHQYYNAKYFVDGGAAEVFREKEITVEQLQDRVLALMRSPQALHQMATQAKRLSVPDSTQQFAEIVRHYIH